MRRYAMLMGSYMGGFLIVKFALFPLGFSYPFLNLLFVAMTLCVPFMGYAYMRLYRDKVCGGSIGVLHAWATHIHLYAYAALLAALPHYIYFRYIDRGLIADSYQAQWEQMQQVGGSEVQSYAPMMEETLQTLQQLTPFDWTLNLLGSDIMAGVLLGLPVALIVRRANKTCNS